MSDKPTGYDEIMAAVCYIFILVPAVFLVGMFEVSRQFICGKQTRR